MTLVDTSVWIDHLRGRNTRLVTLLEAGDVLTHSFVIGELALGNLGGRTTILRDLRDLPRTAVATDDEVLRLIEANSLWGRGIGYVDAHLLAAVRLTANTELWTADRRLHGVALHLGLAA